MPLLLGTTDTRPAARMLGAPPPAAAGALGAELRRAWVAFATTGDPGWPRYGAAGTTRRWDPDPTDVPDPLAASAAIWGDPGS